MEKTITISNKDFDINFLAAWIKYTRIKKRIQPGKFMSRHMFHKPLKLF